jgi:hypothetical protein
LIQLAAAVSQERVTVGRHRDEPVDRVPDARLFVAEQFRHQLEGRGELRVEVVGGERHLGGGEHGLLVGRDRLWPDEYRPVHVRADLHVAAVLPLVHALVDVAHDRVGDLAGRPGEQADRADADHLVHDRGQRQPGASQRGDLRRPHAAADHHVVGGDLPLARDDAGHPAGVGRDVEDLGAGDDGERAVGLGLLPHQRPGAQAVDDADRGEVAAAKDDGRVQVGDQLLHALRGEVLGGDAPRLGLRDPALQLLHPLRRPGDFDAAGLGEDTERLVLLGRVPGQLEHQPCVLDGEDEVGRVAGAAARVWQRSLVHKHDVFPAEQGQMVNEAVAYDARADYDGARARWNVAHGYSSSNTARAASSPVVPVSIRVSGRLNWSAIRVACSVSSGVALWASQTRRV